MESKSIAQTKEVRNILLGINGFVLTQYNSMGSSDKETGKIMSQPAKKSKGTGGSAVNAKKAQPKRR